MTDVFDELERQLRRAVRVPDNVRPLRRGWGWRRTSAFALAAALVVSGAAIAATQLLRIGKPIEELGAPKPDPHVGAGVVQGGVRLLPVRAADPAGGPPWALRVFDSSRGGSCVQLGRVYRGRFGLVSAASAGSTQVAFRELRAVPGINSLCGGVERDGFPVLRGLRRVEVEGGASDPRRCRSASGKLDQCPITAVRIIRYGLLGPAAKEAIFVDAGGAQRASMPIRPGTGGAYLFVVATDPRPYQRRDDAQREWQRDYRQALQRAQRSGLSQTAAMQRAMRTVRRRSAGVAPPRTSDAVMARFANGHTLRVAGPGRTSAQLPGVERRTGSAPHSLRTALDVRRHGSGPTTSFTVRFRAPVAIARADRHYTLTIDGRAAGSCTRRIPHGGYATTHDIARGEPVSFTVAAKFAGWNRRTWCPGRFTIRVGYETPGTGFRGRLVGTYEFTVR
jgi:hypothetical protein